MPTALRLLHGERHRDRFNDAEPIPRSARLEVPGDVSAEVARVWSERVVELEAMGIAFASDVDSWRAYCEAVVMHEKASALLARSPLLVEGRDGNLVKNPAIQIQRDAAATLLRFAQQFGLTPSARSVVKALESKSDGDENPFAGLGG